MQNVSIGVRRSEAIHGVLLLFVIGHASLWTRVVTSGGDGRCRIAVAVADEVWDEEKEEGREGGEVLSTRERGRRRLMKQCPDSNIVRSCCQDSKSLASFLSHHI